MVKELELWIRSSTWATLLPNREPTDEKLPPDRELSFAILSELDAGARPR